MVTVFTHTHPHTLIDQHFYVTSGIMELQDCSLLVLHCWFVYVWLLHKKKIIVSYYPYHADLIKNKQ